MPGQLDAVDDHQAQQVGGAGPAATYPVDAGPPAPDIVTEPDVGVRRDDLFFAKGGGWCVRGNGSTCSRNLKTHPLPPLLSTLDKTPT